MRSLLVFLLLLSACSSDQVGTLRLDATVDSGDAVRTPDAYDATTLDHVAEDGGARD